MAKTKKPKLSVQPKDGKFAVENDETGEVLETADTEQEAEHELEELETEDDLGEDPADKADKEAADDSQKLTTDDVAAQVKTLEGEPVTEHNPHGLDIHERFARLLVTLKKRGIHHSEEAHPLQNAQTTPGNFAK